MIIFYFKMMTFDVCNASDIFQRFMNRTFELFVEKFLRYFIDYFCTYKNNKYHFDYLV